MRRWLARHGIGGYYVSLIYPFKPPYPPVMVFGPYPSPTIDVARLGHDFGVMQGLVMVSYRLRPMPISDQDVEAP